MTLAGAPTLSRGGEERVVAKVRRRLIPFLVACFFCSYLDRVNIGFAALTMNRELGFSPQFYGLGAGVFFLGYCLFEAPSNYVMHRVGARRWIARIMISWGVVSALMAFVYDGASFVLLRLLLGVAEAGFAPGVLLYLTYWTPPAHRARIMASFLFAVPLSSAFGAPLSSLLLTGFDGVAGIAGWRWLFLIEAAPTLALGISAFFLLDDRPSEARWLQPTERDWLTEKIGAAPREDDLARALRALRDPDVLTLGLVYFGVVGALYGLSFWLPQMVASLGFGVLASGLLTALPYVFGVIGMAVCAARSDRSQDHFRHIAIAAALAASGLAACAYAPAPLVALIALCLGAAGTLGAMPVIWSLAASRLSGVEAAIGLAMINSIGNVAGFVGPYLIGWVKGQTGDFSAALLTLASLPAMSAAMALWLRRRG